MVTMILVEDESFERRALIEHIDWNLIGVEVIGEAINGEQGLSLVMERHPDIVLSDVSMPAMNGVEMARKIRAIAPETRILFLSAYDEFDYAKQAIDLNVQAYVMKPVNESELLRESGDTVNDIAASCGFGSITSFHTCFKKRYGITPVEYRLNQTGAPQ